VNSKSSVPTVTSARKPQTATGASAARTQAIGAAVLIGGATLAVFWGATACGFVNLDDDLYVSENAHVQEGLTLRSLAYAAKSVEGGSWMPLTWGSYLLDTQFWGTGAAGYHATNVVLHALSASLLFLALRMMTGVFWPCAFAAALFALHPLRVESVVWIAERKDVLSGVFFVLTLMAYARFAATLAEMRPAASALPQSRSAGSSRLISFGWLRPAEAGAPLGPGLSSSRNRRRAQRASSLSSSGGEGRGEEAVARPSSILHLPSFSAAASPRGNMSTLGVVGLFMLLGLLAKPMLVTAPFLLLLLDFWPLGRMGSSPAEIRARLPALAREKLPLLVLSAVFSVITVLSQSSVGAVARPESGAHRILRIADNYGFYLEKVIWPNHLNVLYPITSVCAFRAGVVLAGILVVSFATMLWLRKRPWLAVGWFWFLGGLFPVIGVVAIGSTWVADRYTYLPSIGIGLMLVWTAKSLLPATRPARISAALAAVLLLAVLSWATVNNLPRWHDSYTLFSDSVSKGTHPGAYQNLGIACAERGDHETAISHYTHAIELAPDSDEAYYNRALAFQAKGEAESGLVDYSRAIELRPAYAEAHNNRGNLYAAGGQFDPAIRDFTRAITLRPHYTEALANRGHAYQETGKYREAVDDYSKAISAKPDFAAAYHDRAAAYYLLKDYEQAWADIRMCRQLGLNPNPELVRRLEADSGRRD
jgi:Tfp pilus assembly protein PilF